MARSTEAEKPGVKRGLTLTRNKSDATPEKPSKAEKPTKVKPGAKPQAEKRVPAKRQAATLPTTMRVELIPPSVEVRRKQNALVRLLAFGLVGLLALVVAAGAATWFLAGNAERQLADEQLRNVTLLKQENTYSDLKDTTTRLGEYKSATIGALFAEADWNRLLTQLDAALPPETMIQSETIAVKGFGKGASAVDDASKLDAQGVISIDFTAKGPGIGSTTAFLAGLQQLTGYKSATASSVVNADDGTYTVTANVQLSAAALGGTARTAALDQDELKKLHELLETSVTEPVAPTPAPSDTAAATKEG